MKASGADHDVSVKGGSLGGVMDAGDEEKDSVSIWFVRQALMRHQAEGRPVEPLLEASGISARMLAQDQSRVSANTFGRLWLNIAAELDDEFFGLDRRRMKVGSFALLCRSTVLSHNLGQALSLSEQFFRVVLDDLQLESDCEGAHLHIRLIDAPDADRPEAFRLYAHETLLIMLHGLLCWLAGRRLPILETRLAYPPPQWWSEYRSMYCDELKFDQPQSTMTLDAEVLESPVVQDEDSTRAFLREAPHNFIVKFKDPKSFRARIRRRLRDTAPMHWPKLELLARDLGVAPSTLHRKLGMEGTSFRQIKDALRRDLAIDRLVHSDSSVADIADELGFAEPSAFHRAFRGWTGLRPGDYR